MLSRRLCTALGGQLCRLSSSNVMPPLPESQERVVIADGGRTIVCWHPEEPFPYEFTQPLPVQKLPEDVTVLKDLKLSYKDVSLEEARNKLAQLAATTKHRWYPQPKRCKRKPEIKPDRDYL